MMIPQNYKFLYSKLKSEIEIEKYLSEEFIFKNRQMIIKLCVSDHTLKVEIGRYKNIPRENRNCKICKDKIEDEYHFKQNLNLRNKLFTEIDL